MPTISLRAHFDGASIQLDEPFELPTNVPLLVTVLTEEDRSGDVDWLEMGHRALERAYGKDEPEYSVADLEP